MQFVFLLAMNANTIHRCCKEVKDAYVKHTCSVRRSTHKVGDSIHPSLISDKEHQICLSLNLRLECSTPRDKKKFLDKNITNSKDSKKMRRGLEDALSSEFKKPSLEEDS